MTYSYIVNDSRDSRPISHKCLSYVTIEFDGNERQPNLFFKNINQDLSKKNNKRMRSISIHDLKGNLTIHLRFQRIMHFAIKLILLSLIINNEGTFIQN